MDLDVVVLGTGLTESIVAAALSKAGYKVGHLDTNPYYGADHASLSVDELIQWADERNKSNGETSSYILCQRERFTDISYSGSVPAHSRQFALSLCPTIIPSIGPLIDSLVASGVSRYGGFKLLEQVALYESPGVVKPVPGSKEDIFKNTSLSLLHKRRLMRFLMFAGGEFEDKPELQGNEDTPFPDFLKNKFSLDDAAIQAIAYALSFCVSASDPTLPALHRIRRYLRSTGRYGSSPFLFGHYGGVGEIAQGFCRTAAVAGATYVLGRQILSAQAANAPEGTSRKYSVQLQELEENIDCDVLISSLDYVSLIPAGKTSLVSRTSSQSHSALARCIAIIDQPFSFSGAEPEPEKAEDQSEEEIGSTPPMQKGPLDTAVLVLPPGSVSDGSHSVAVHALVTGEASMSTPRGKWVVYLSMPLMDEDTHSKSAEQLLRPYLDATLSVAKSMVTSDEPSPPPQTLFTMFYKQHPTSLPAASSEVHDASPLLSNSSAPFHLPEIADSTVSIADAIFWRAVEQLKAAGRRPQRKDGDGGEDLEASDIIDSLWPPLEYVEEENEW